MDASLDANALAVYLIGRPQCGKTTVFHALAGDAEGGHQRVVKVPDPRLDRLFAIFRPRRQVHAEIIYSDIFAQRAGELTGRRAERFTAALGEADMLGLVVRCFGALDADGEPLDPVRALDEVLLELVVADHSVLAKRLERVETDLKKGRKELAPEAEVLRRCLPTLEAEQPLTRLELDAEAQRLLRGFQLLTLKPAIVLANLEETALERGAPPELVAFAAERGFQTIGLAGQLEAEIVSLEPNERSAFLADYGIAEASRDRVIRACYDSLDLISFLTGGGPDEVRAWTIRRGTTAVQAAGTIHSDLERGFIRAETVAFGELDRLGSLTACRDAGVLRLEGRDYVVRDGDVITFRFNV